MPCVFWFQQEMLSRGSYFQCLTPQLSAILKAVAPVGGGSCLVEYVCVGGGPLSNMPSPRSSPFSLILVQSTRTTLTARSACHRLEPLCHAILITMAVGPLEP